jgi:cytochrome P450
MEVSALVSLVQDYRVVAGLVLLAIVLQRVLAYPYTRWRTTRLNRARGCQPAPRLPSRDPFLALDVVMRLRSLIKRRELLARVPELFEAAGSWSVEVNLAGRRVLWLAEPELVKTVLMTKVKDWRIGDSRRETITPAFGPNIIVAEGELWHETRSVMRPAFARKQFGDLELLDMHVSRLLEKLPRDGAEVDLKPLFFKLSMDYSTEFL